MDVYGLIGYPLGHSFSKKYFTSKFEKENIKDCIFENFPLKDIAGIKNLVADNTKLKGLAVTVPYKESVIPYIRYLDVEAVNVGAVNCISIRNGKLTGSNTDIIGFERSLPPRLQNRFPQALVLGSGGSSKAIQYVLNKLGISFLIVSRQKIQQENAITYEQLNEKYIREYPLIINTTPVGMTPNENTLPAIPYQYLNHNNLLYDLIYNPSQTLFLKNGMEKGASVKNGYEMLVIQAEENWRIWNEL